MAEELKSAFAHVLWIGGAQWAGKTSVARIVAQRNGLQLYHYDYHDGRGHSERARANPDRYPRLSGVLSMTADEAWVSRTPDEMARSTLGVFEERFQMALDDLRAMAREPLVVAEGWGIRPHLVAPLLSSPRQAVYLVPSERFRRRQLAALPRAQRISALTSNPELAQQKRLERDRILASEVADSARNLGMRVITVDVPRSLEEIAQAVDRHFEPLTGR